MTHVLVASISKNVIVSEPSFLFYSKKPQEIHELIIKTQVIQAFSLFDRLQSFHLRWSVKHNGVILRA